MASFDYRLNPLYAIKECSSCGALYTTDYCCSKGGLVDKIIRERPPQNCATCGDPVDGLYCRPCAFVRKCLNEGWYTIHDENEILNTSESSNDNTNIVSAPQEPFVFNQDPGKNSSQSPPHIDHHCCYECGDSLDDIFCQRCTCKSCGKGAHYGYNCPPQIPIISNPEPCYNQNLNEILQNLQSLQQQCLLGTCQQCGCNEYDGVCFYCTVGNGTPINFSTPYSSNDSPSFANHPPQPQYVPYSCELCGNDAHHGYDCPPQVPFVYNQDPCSNQNFDYFPQTSPSFPQQYPCCEDCGGPHETFQCQPMNYYEPNPCYDSNYSGFDQTQPPQYTVNHPIFNAQNELLNSQNKIMEQMTSICDMVGQYMQKKEEDRRIAEDQAAKDRYWKIPICYDDDEDYTIAITPVLSTEEPVDSLIMEDEHLDAIPATESDEVIKSSVENLVPTPSESEGIPDKMCDVPLCDHPTPLEAIKEHFEIVVEFNDDSTSSDDDYPYGEDINYVDASSPDSELVSLEVVENVTSEDGEIEDDILREKLSKINLLIAKIDAMNSNPPPSSDLVIKSSSTSLNFFLEETNTFDNSIPESKTFCFDLEDNSWWHKPLLPSNILFRIKKHSYLDDDHIGRKFRYVNRTHIISPSEYDHFYFKFEPELGNFTMDVVEDIFDNPTREPRVHVPNVLPTHPTLYLDSDFILSSDSLGSDLVVSFPSRTRNKIFDPGIFIGV
ncbi:hypothetical protein Tco_1067048 [Tanacetum coccineum]|uniref:CCHC-type domain-containing protein n=1 Tax=Tanacetum coccineum TaxID=301880 RepID=A0ABQ5HD56_9ASTR